jgi:hypothetical protein
MIMVSPGKRTCRPDGPERAWSLLPNDAIALDYCMDFRAACGSWRRATDDPRKKHGADDDPRFQPRMWAVQKHSGSPLSQLRRLHGEPRDLPLAL